MQSIDKDVVSHVAFLSRISLNPEELTLYSTQLASILAYINKLNELDTKDTPPTSHALADLKNRFRKDILKASLPQEEALKNAPASEDGFFKVPQVIDPSAKAQDSSRDCRGTKGK